MCNTEKMKYLINPLLNLLINEETLNKDQRNYKIIQKLKQLSDNKSFYESMINQNLPYNFSLEYQQLREIKYNDRF